MHGTWGFGYYNRTKNELFSNDQLKIKKAAHAIESAMMKKMAEFEGYSDAQVKALRAKNK